MLIRTLGAMSLAMIGTLAPVMAQDAAAPAAQQVLQRGALGRPSQVLDETGQWTAPLLVNAEHDTEMYIPDVSNQVWLKRNYRDFMDRGQYVITMFTFYRNPTACRANQTGWGLGDQAHLDACATAIGYRLREATIDTNLKTVTLIQAGMVDTDGNLDASSLQQQPLTRRWAELDRGTQSALAKTTEMVSRQIARYDRRVQSAR